MFKCKSYSWPGTYMLKKVNDNFPEYRNIESEIYRFIFILQNCWKKYANFVYDAMEIRKNFIVPLGT